jgi:SAM-dependent methyltransferase
MVGSPTKADESRPTNGAGMGGEVGEGGKAMITGLPARLIPLYDRIDIKIRREATRLAGLSFTELPAREAARMAYNVLLRRDPDPTAWDEYTGALTDRLMAYEDMVDRIRTSSEFRTVAQPRATGLHGSLHASRCEFIIGLPRARRIIDVGGGHTSDGRGALVALGYPYDFEELVIVDLPPEDRHDLYKSDPFGDGDTDRGRVRYEYRSMVDLSFAEEASVDLVYSGQSIEHVPESAGDDVLAGAFRALRPGGYMAIDTPNGRLCRMQQDDFIDPDHDVEYTLEQLRDKVIRAGFEIETIRGLNWGGPGVAQGRFDLAALSANYGIHHAADECYLLALLIRKPV